MAKGIKKKVIYNTDEEPVSYAEEAAVQYETMKVILGGDRKSTRLNSSHLRLSRMPSSA